MVHSNSGEIETVNSYELRSMKNPDGTSVPGGKERPFSEDSVEEAYKAETAVDERIGEEGQSTQRPSVASVDGDELSRPAYDLGGELSPRSRKQTEHLLSETSAGNREADSGGFPGRSEAVPGYRNPEETEGGEGEGSDEDRSLSGGAGSDVDNVIPENPLDEHAANDTVALQEVQVRTVVWYFDPCRTCIMVSSFSRG